MKIEYNKFLKAKRIKSPAFLDFVRTCPCEVSGGAAVAHHENFWNGSTALKASDIFTVPLSPHYHTNCAFSIHAIGWEAFEDLHNINIMHGMLKRLEYFISAGGRF